MDFTGERYIDCKDTAGQLIEQEHWQRYMMAADAVNSSDVVLDIACGSGYGSEYLSRRAREVYGVDISEETILYASHRYSRANLRFIQGDVACIPLDDHCVDVVVSFETIEHVDESVQRAFLREIKRVMKPAGKLIISCPNKPVASDLAYELWGSVNEFHKKEHTEASFRALLEQYFPHISLLYQRSEHALVVDAPGAEVLHIQWGERKHRDDTQNFIALCGAQPIDPVPFSYIMPDIYNRFIESEKVLAKYVKTVETQTKDIQSLAEQKQEAERQWQNEQRELQTAISDNLLALKKAERDKESNIKYIGELQAAIADSLRDADANIRYIGELQAAITGNLQELDTCKEEIKAVTEENAQLRAQFSDFRTQAEAQITMLQEDIQAQAKQNGALISAQKERIAELETIEQSRLWRMTKPLRRIMDWLKRAVRTGVDP